MSRGDLTVDFRMSGIEELQKAIAEQLPSNFAKAVGRKAFKAGADVIAHEATNRAITHQDTGLLARNIVGKGDAKATVVYAGRKRINIKGEYIMRGKVGVAGEKLRVFRRRSGAEAESTADFIGPRKDGYWQWANPQRYAALVEFGTYRTAAHPFMRPAVESKGKAAIDAIIRVIETELPKAVTASAIKATTGAFKP